MGVDDWMKLEEMASICDLSPNAFNEVLIKFKIKVKYFDSASFSTKVKTASEDIYGEYFDTIQVHVRDFAIILEDQRIYNTIEVFADNFKDQRPLYDIDNVDENVCKVLLLYWKRLAEIYEKDLNELRSGRQAQANIALPVFASDVLDGNPTLKTNNAIVANLKKRVVKLIDGYSGAAQIACEIGRRGPKNGNPWSEAEIRTLANELGVSIKGDCLKAFKAGMPPELVKKDAGARPTNPREEFLDDEAS